MHQPLVYILILNYSSLDDTIDCVEYVKQINYTNYRLLVIDNNSPDGSGKTLSDKLPSQEFVQLSKNTGYAGGNNIGFKIALENKASYILVLNPDVRLPPTSITHYVEVLEHDKSIGALNPVQLTTDGQSIDDSFDRAVLSNASPYQANHFTCLKEAKTLFGAALMLPKRTVEQVGGFDPLFFAYGEEEDFCRRIQLRGLKLIVTTESPVIHKRTKENQTASDFVLFLRLKGSYLFNLKNPQLGFRYALKRFSHDILHDLRGKRSNTYPFNKYPIKIRHILRAGYWVLLNLLPIRRHRKLDRTNSPYV